MHFLLLCALPLLAAANRPVLTFGRPKGGFLANFDVDQFGYPWSEDKYMVYSNITQTVDHFNPNNTQTWKQRYQYNKKFQKAQNGINIVFLMIGGEGSISPPGDKWVRNENITMMQWAQEYKAAAFQLEHRFYGPKANTPLGGSQTVDALRLLTIDQALADIKSFIQQMNDMYFKGKTTKWVTFGGSYPGSLSAFFRETYPEMTIGAVSTSSAVHVQVDYYGYAVNTQANYNKTKTGCADSIGKGFQSIINMAYNGVAGRELLKQRFNLCDSFDETNLSKSLQFFFSNVFGIFQGINQYTGDNRNNATASGLGLGQACDLMTNATIGDEVARIKAVWDLYNSWYNGYCNMTTKCNCNSYSAFIQQYSDTSYTNVDDTVPTRSWIWQTCTELGYFQTTDGGQGSIFGSIIPTDFYADQCTALFGPEFNLDNTYKLVAAVKQKYGAPDKYRGTNVVFPNGSSDPWKSLGLLAQYANANNGVTAFLMDDTAHCADMYPARTTDLKSLQNGREQIHKQLDQWIKAALQQSGTSSISFFAVILTVMLKWI